MKRKLSISVGPHEAGISLLDLLTRRFTYHDREKWEGSIRAGEVLLNQKPTLPIAILAVGDAIEYIFAEAPEPPVNARFSILFEDDVLLVVNKPGNLPCHPGGRYFKHSLWALLKTRFHLTHLAFVNRIDRETSGIVLLAKSPKAALHCRQQFERHEVRKRYVALVEGEFPTKTIRAEGYLMPDTESPVRKRLCFHPAASPYEIPKNAKVCNTRFRRIRIRNSISQLEAVPETGRSHQIRATLSSMGYPLVGDKLYGVDERLFLRFIQGDLNDKDRKRLRLPRQALHSAELHITHPETAKPLRLSAPLPDDMQTLMGRKTKGN